MIIPSRLFRAIGKYSDKLCSWSRVLRLKLLYPDLALDFRTRIEKNCKIVCMRGGRMAIKGSHISYGSMINCSQNADLTISDSFIGRNCVITSKEKVVIDSGCLIAEMVVIRDQDHVLNNFGRSDTRNNFSTSPVTISQNVWIGSKATILKGSNIGENSVIAASAVVNQEVLANEIWAGIPAKFIKKINNE